MAQRGTEDFRGGYRRVHYWHRRVRAAEAKKSRWALFTSRSTAIGSSKAVKLNLQRGRVDDQGAYPPYERRSTYLQMILDGTRNAIEEKSGLVRIVDLQDEDGGHDDRAADDERPA